METPKTCTQTHPYTHRETHRNTLIHRHGDTPRHRHAYSHTHKETLTDMYTERHQQTHNTWDAGRQAYKRHKHRLTDMHMPQMTKGGRHRCHKKLQGWETRTHPHDTS